MIADVIESLREQTRSRLHVEDSDRDSASNSNDDDVGHAPPNVEPDQFLHLEDLETELDKLDEDGLFPYQRLGEVFERELAEVGACQNLSFCIKAVNPHSLQWMILALVTNACCGFMPSRTKRS